MSMRQKNGASKNIYIYWCFDNGQAEFQKLERRKLFKMLIQGIEPWSVPWEGTMIPLHQMRFTFLGSHNNFKEYNKL